MEGAGRKDARASRQRRLATETGEPRPREATTDVATGAVRSVPSPEHDRYVVEEVLGQGGQGVVYRARDLELGRQVALKTLRADTSSTELGASFLAEARAAASLEHPNIVPIHDVGVLKDGRPFYVMRYVTGSSFSEVLDRTLDDAASRTSLVRRVQVVQQVARALEHAHEHGVLHRDVKPANILVGPVGEVLLVDWGIAKSSTSGRTATVTGIVKGTAAYMSPEQARGTDLDARSDVYSLGVVLFECLTLRLPFESEHAADLLAAILRDEAPDPRELAPDRWVPDELAELTRRALAKDREQRTASARELHDGLQSFVEGLRDRERRLEAASSAHDAGEQALERHAASVRREGELAAELDRLEKDHPPWQPIGEKRALFEVRRRLEATRVESQAAFLEAVNRFTDALAHLPDHAPSRQALADTFLERFRVTEERGDAARARTYRSLVERFHDGRFARELRGHGRLRLRVEPPDARVRLHAVEERDLVLVDGPPRDLGAGDVRLDDVPMGAYVAVASAPGRVTARLPVLVERCGEFTGVVTLPEAAELPEGFELVAGASVRLGGDARATNGWPAREVTVPSFFMKRHPVTYSEYCLFLDALAADGAELDERIPCTATEGALCHRTERGYVPTVEPSKDLVRRHGPDVAGCLPVVGVRREDAEAYARWLGDRLGRVARLPTAEEWEYAARGADRRIHPWGNRHDGALAATRDAVEGEPEPFPVGAKPADCSVFGVRDLAGCVQEWTSSEFDPARSMAEVRGGGWQTGAIGTRCCWRGAASPDQRNVYLGFRVVVPWPGVGPSDSP